MSKERKYYVKGTYGWRAYESKSKKDIRDNILRFCKGGDSAEILTENEFFKKYGKSGKLKVNIREKVSLVPLILIVLIFSIVAIPVLFIFGILFVVSERFRESWREMESFDYYEYHQDD